MNLLAVFIVFVVFKNTIIQPVASAKGSTPSLKQIVLGRCKDYLEVKGKSSNLNPRDCDTLWKTFSKSFAFKDRCDLRFHDYKEFFDAAQDNFTYKDKAMFWSGTHQAAHFYSYFDLRFTTLEDTLVGSMMDGLNWCGNPSLPQNSTDGIDYNSCPSCDENNIVFWKEASKRFAKQVRGIVRVILNGTRGNRPAFSNNSIFAQYELPNLQVHDITKLWIIVIHTIGKQPIEKCGKKSVKQLKRRAKKYGLKVGCRDDPDAVKHILCIDDSKAEECKFKEKTPKDKVTPTESRHETSYHEWQTIAIVFVVLFGVLLILVVVIAALFRRKPEPYSVDKPVL